MTTDLALDRTPLAGVPRFDGGPTPEQQHALRALGLGESSCRHAAAGRDVFAYVEDEHSTLRVQITPDGRVVGQTVLDRGPILEAG